MTEIEGAFYAAARPRDKRSRSAWACDNIIVPNSARASRMDLTVTPWAIEPIDMSADNRVREQIILWPTGAGKTNFLDANVPHAVEEDGGDILLAVQGNTEAKLYVETRLIPSMRSVPGIKAKLDCMGRFACKKGIITLPHMVIYWGGVNETNAQAKSVRTVLVDEAWMAEHGLLEQFRARLHNRWNRRFVALGQGGMEKLSVHGQMVDTEWHAAWLRTDQREWCFQCPQCNEVQRYRLRGLLYNREHSDTGELDETAVAESARYQCIGATRDPQTCDAVFPDNVNTRRMLSRTGRYVIQHPRHREHHHGWHLNALGIWYETWGDIAVLHANAHAARKAGDFEPLKIFRQKRMAENYREEEELPQTALTKGDYDLADYMDGAMWPGEAIRIATIDRQRDHFWMVIRAWKADGTSRRLWVGRINTIEAVCEKLKTMKVKPNATFEDSGFEADDVYNDCGRYGWTALKGDGLADSFPHPARKGQRFFYSPPRPVSGTSQRPASLRHWAVLPIKRILEKMRGGYRDSWEVERDISPLHERHLFSEIERDFVSKGTKQITRAFVRRHKENHTWDCEAMQVVGALGFGMLADAPEAPAPSAEPPEDVNA